MKKICILYYSKYGSTEEYANMISESVGADILKFSNNNIDDILKYDVIVMGSGIYADNLKVRKYIKKNFDKLKTKHLIVFGVGASPVNEENILKIKKANFKNINDEELEFYLLRGAFNYEKLTFEDKIMMSMFKVTISEKKEQDEATKAILECLKKPESWIEENQISEIVASINKG